MWVGRPRGTRGLAPCAPPTVTPRAGTHVLDLSPVERKALFDLAEYELDRIRDLTVYVHSSRDAETLSEAARVYVELWRGVEHGALTIDAGIIGRIEKNLEDTVRMVEEEQQVLVRVRAGDRGVVHVGSSAEETARDTIKHLTDLSVEVEGCTMIVRRATEAGF